MKRPSPIGEVGRRAKTDAARARALELMPIVAELEEGSRPSRLAVALNMRNIPAPRGGKWTTASAARLLMVIQLLV